MAIDNLNNISNEQLMAMSMMSNGQLTNNSTSTNSTSGDANLAFSLMMQNLINSSKNSSEASSVIKDGDSKVVQQNATGTDLEKIAMILKNSNRINVTNNITSNRSKADLDKIYSAVETASKKYGVDKNLILAIIKQESDFNPSVVSSAGAKGLMQLMPENVLEAGISNPYDVNQNIDGGTKQLKGYLKQYNGNVEMALMAYNAGPGTVKRRGVLGINDLYKLPKETQHYVPKVMGYYKNGI